MALALLSLRTNGIYCMLARSDTNMSERKLLAQALTSALEEYQSQGGKESFRREELEEFHKGDPRGLKALPQRAPQGRTSDDRPPSSPGAWQGHGRSAARRPRTEADQLRGAWGEEPLPEKRQRKKPEGKSNSNYCLVNCAADMLFVCMHSLDDVVLI